MHANIIVTRTEPGISSDTAIDTTLRKSKGTTNFVNRAQHQCWSEGHFRTDLRRNGVIFIGFSHLPLGSWLSAILPIALHLTVVREDTSFRPPPTAAMREWHEGMQQCRYDRWESNYYLIRRPTDDERCNDQSRHAEGFDLCLAEESNPNLAALSHHRLPMLLLSKSFRVYGFTLFLCQQTTQFFNQFLSSQLPN